MFWSFVRDNTLTKLLFCLNQYGVHRMLTLKEFARKQTSYECILVDMIIDSDGIPICFRFKQQIEPVIKAKLTDKLKLLRFKPAIIRNKRVESIYTIKI